GFCHVEETEVQRFLALAVARDSFVQRPYLMDDSTFASESALQIAKTESSFDEHRCAFVNNRLKQFCNHRINSDRAIVTAQCWITAGFGDGNDKAIPPVRGPLRSTEDDIKHS